MSLPFREYEGGGHDVILRRAWLSATLYSDFIKLSTVFLSALVRVAGCKGMITTRENYIYLWVLLVMQ